MSLEVKAFRRNLDELNINHHFDRESSIVGFTFEFPELPNYSVQFCYEINEEANRVSAYAYLSKEHILDNSDDYDVARHFCNQWNRDTIMPKVFLDEERKILVCEWIWDTDMELPDDVVKNQMIRRFISVVSQFTEASIKARLYRDIPEQMWTDVGDDH